MGSLHVREEEEKKRILEVSVRAKKRERQYWRCRRTERMQITFFISSAVHPIRLIIFGRNRRTLGKHLWQDKKTSMTKRDLLFPKRLKTIIRGKNGLELMFFFRFQIERGQTPSMKSCDNPFICIWSPKLIGCLLWDVALLRDPDV